MIAVNIPSDELRESASLARRHTMNRRILAMLGQARVACGHTAP